MNVERRPDGSIALRERRVMLRVGLFVAGVAVLLGVAVSEPENPVKLGLGAIVALVGAGIAALVPAVSFDFDAIGRTLSWSRSSLLRPRSGELPFDAIEDVTLRAHLYSGGSDTDRHPTPVYRIELCVSGGQRLRICERGPGTEAEQLALANAIRALLGRPLASAVADVSVEDLVAEGDRIGAIKLARRLRGLSLTQSKQLVDALRQAR